MKTALMDKSRIWNCWTNNMVREGGDAAYIIHMFDEPLGEKPNPRTLCGVRWAETGLMTLHETEPGCIKCRRILRNRGLLNH